VIRSSSLMNTIMRILDLFAGIGGFSLGLHRASKEFKTVAFCEQDPFCTQILNKHWPDVPVYPDIKELTYERLKADGVVADSEIIGIQGSGTLGEQESSVSARQEISGCNGTGSGGSNRPTQRGMGHLADGLSAELLDIGSIWHIEPDIPRVTTGEKNRVKKLKALGNSVVPQIPEILGRLIMEIEREV